jgi:DNA-binding FrmR family transcriptional regulator
MRFPHIVLCVTAVSGRVCAFITLTSPAFSHRSCSSSTVVNALDSGDLAAIADLIDQKLDKHLEPVLTELAAVSTELAAIMRSIDELHEDSVRHKLVSLRSTEYIKAAKLTTLQNVVDLLPDTLSLSSGWRTDMLNSAPLAF